MATVPALPNPLTPLAWIPPSLASQFEVSRYVLVATCGMFAWDILINLRNDWNLLTKYHIRFPTIVYFISRFSAFAHTITGAAFTISPVGNCQALQVAIGCCYAVAVPATALLFYFRVKAIFNNSTFIAVLFGFLWLSTLAASITVPFATEGSHIGLTNHCINTGVKPFSSAGVIIATVNDTLVFIFITYRLLVDTTYDDSWRGRLRSFFKGKGLPAFSQSLLQSGQEYYLITVGGNILAMSMILAPASLPPVFHVVFTIPNVAINNSMACRVYRDIKFGHISSSGTTVQSTTLPSLVAKPHETIKLPAYRQRNGLETFELEIGGSGANTFNQASYVEGGVHITESVQHVSSEDNAKLKISLTHSTSQIDRQRLSVEI